MEMIHRTDVPRIEVDMDGARNAYMQVPIGVKEGTPAYSMRIFTLKPGGHTPYHKHDFEHINYIISGKGILQSKHHSMRFWAGDCILIKPNEVHQYKNTSAKLALVFICLVPKENECGCPDKETNNGVSES